MNTNGFHQRVWDGNYGCGSQSLLSQAKRAYEEERGGNAILTIYASTLYSVARDPKAWLSWCPQGPLAACRLYWLLKRELPRRFTFGFCGAKLVAQLSADECETLAAILIATYDLPLLAKDQQWIYMASALVTQGCLRSVPGTSEHTQAFLLVHSARLQYWSELGKRHSHLRSDHAPSEVEDDERLALQKLAWAGEHAEKVTSPNQQSRCFRAIASAYAQRHMEHEASVFFTKMDLVGGISDSVLRKNRRARERWGK